MQPEHSNLALFAIRDPRKVAMDGIPSEGPFVRIHIRCDAIQMLFATTGGPFQQDLWYPADWVL